MLHSDVSGVHANAQGHCLLLTSPAPQHCPAGPALPVLIGAVFDVALFHALFGAVAEASFDDAGPVSPTVTDEGKQRTVLLMTRGNKSSRKDKCHPALRMESPTRVCFC